MNKLFPLIALLFLVTLCTSAQKVITTYHIAESYGFDKPFVIDSVNNKGKSFAANAYLQAPTNSKQAAALRTIQTDSDFLMLPKSDKTFTINTLYFHVATTDFSKTKFEILTNAQFKLSLADKQVREKLTSEKTIDTAKKVVLETQLEPGDHILGITLLSDCKDVTYQLRITLPDTKGPDANNGLTLRAMLCGKNPYSVQMAHHGDYYIVKYADTDANGKRTYNAEIRRSKDNATLYATDNYTISWMPVSSRCTFRKGDKIYTLDPINPHEELLCEHIPEGDIYWLNDEQRFILVQTVKPENETKTALHRMYLPDDRIPAWRNRVYLSLYNIADHALRPLTFGTHSTYLNDIQADGNHILFSVSRDSITAAPFVFNSLYEMDLNTLRTDTLVSEDAAFINAQYIPGSDEIAVLGGGNFHNNIGLNIPDTLQANFFNQALFLLNRKTRQIRAVSKLFDPSVSHVIPRNKNLYLTCINHDSISVFRYNLKAGTFELLPLNLDVVHAFDIDFDEKNCVFYGENYNKPNRVFAARNGLNNIKEVSFPKKAQYEQWQLGNMECWSFRSANGSRIDGRIYYPAGFNAANKYPMIVYYYGGCEPTNRSFEMRYSAWLYTQQGYIVYVINPSGTTGWGQEFAARHVNAWGKWTADEIIEGVQRLCQEKPFINRAKIGCMGASYGGFMTQYLQTRTNIFAAAVSHAGISNITSYWGSGYWGYSYGAAAQTGSYPWNNPQLYTEHSPLFHANKIQTPLLLLHGTADTNVPIGESIQMYNALKILGKEVEFITVADENHGINDFEKRIQWNNTIYAWFAKWLKDDASWWESMYPKEYY